MIDKIYIVETISIFRHTYYIKGKEASHVMDEMVCNMDNPEFIQGSQRHIGEEISNVREVSEKEFIKTFNDENDYLSSWTDEQKFKMINVIDYSGD